jgi:lipoprotein-anchoring transpeptidase ErfK/SrfK
MKKFGLLGALFALVLSFSAVAPAPASAATLVARIDISAQRMTVLVNGVPRYTWLVSTARRGYITPVGSFRPFRMERVYYSKKYDNAPMPHAVFFYGGYAVHGTYSVGSLGRPASHGCVRLAPGNAATLYSLVAQYGPGNSRIVVSY